jgi:hypothetical protein
MLLERGGAPDARAAADGNHCFIERRTASCAFW